MKNRLRIKIADEIESIGHCFSHHDEILGEAGIIWMSQSHNMEMFIQALFDMLTHTRKDKRDETSSVQNSEVNVSKHTSLTSHMFQFRRMIHIVDALNSHSLSYHCWMRN